VSPRTGRVRLYTAGCLVRQRTDASSLGMHLQQPPRPHSQNPMLRTAKDLRGLEIVARDGGAGHDMPAAPQGIERVTPAAQPAAA